MPSLLITTLQGERVGSIGNGRKSAQFQLFKQRPWEFDVMDGDDQPLYQIRRLSAGRFASADVLERRNNEWHKIGRVAVEGPSARRETTDATYTLYEKHADGQPERAVATARRASKNRFLFHQHDIVVAGVQEIDKAYVCALTQPLWLPEPHDELCGVAAELAGAQVYRGARHLQGGPRGDQLDHLPVGARAGRGPRRARLEHVRAPAVPRGLLPDLLYVAAAHVPDDYYDADRSASPRVRRGSMGEHASILVSN